MSMALFYCNADLLAWVVEAQQSTLDNSETLAPGASFQTGERIDWMVDRFPE
jgi:hypothetical protein